jgi:hypothetical protein
MIGSGRDGSLARPNEGIDSPGVWILNPFSSQYPKVEFALALPPDPSQGSYLKF